MKKTKDYLPEISLLLSAGLFAFSFPFFDEIPGGFAAWFAFVPLLLSLRREPSLLKKLGRAYLVLLAGSFALALPFSVRLPSLIYAVPAEAFQALFPFLVFFIAEKKAGRKFAFFLFPFAWAAGEYLRLQTEFSFAIFVLSNTQTFSENLLQPAEYLGAYGISFLVIASNSIICTVYESAGRFKLLKGFSAGLLFVFCLNLYGIYAKKNIEKPSEKALEILAVQSGFDPFYRTRNRGKAHLDRLTEMTDSVVSARQKIGKRVDLILWPETSLEFYWTEKDSIFEDLQVASLRWDAALLTGTEERSEPLAPGLRPKYLEFENRDFFRYNSAVLISPELGAFHLKNAEQKVRLNKYRKKHLLPFAEAVPYIRPFGFLAGLKSEIPGGPNLEAGQNAQEFYCAPAAGPKITVGTLICFDRNFPDVARQHCAAGAELLCALSDDGWFSETGKDMLLKFSKLRAVECRRTLVLSGESGRTAVIGPGGKILAACDPNQPGTLSAAVYSLKKLTPYVKYLFRWPLWAFSGIFLLWISVHLYVFSLNRNKL